MTANLFGSVAAYVHFHSRVAMLVLQPEGQQAATTFGPSRARSLPKIESDAP